MSSAESDDVALMGAGDDSFVWNPGDDDDTLEGQDGFDTMLFNGSQAAENANVSANGGRVLFLRNIANLRLLTYAAHVAQTVDRGSVGTGERQPWLVPVRPAA